MKPLPLHEREYRESLARLEKRAIIPLKWVVWLVTVTIWLLVIDTTPSTPVFLLFLIYFLFNCAQTYFFLFSRVNIHQIKPLTLLSYLADVVFVSILIYFDLATPYVSYDTPHNQFYLIYFLLVMRGFALFKTIGETIFVNLLISILYIITVYLQSQDPQALLSPEFTVSLTLIWVVVLMSWFVIMVITRQKTELMEVRERLLRADALAQVGELAAGVAHEINNPISIIVTTAEFIKMSTPPEDDRLEEIQAIQREAMRCKNIVQEMLTYARPRASGMTHIEPIAINQEVLHFVFPRKQNQRFEIVEEYDEKTPMFEADPNLIKQALMNLYVNAKQAIPEDRRGRIVSRIARANKGRTVRIEIEDNGPGIPEEEMDLIFQPFFTRKKHGTGLGLAVTQSIVEKFNGSISVRLIEGKSKKDPPKGTVFTIDFPAL